MARGSKFLALLLKKQGYNPENTFAMWDFNAGRISEAEMWRIFNKNLSETLRSNSVSSLPIEITRLRKPAKPRVKDIVILDDTRTGVVARILYDEGEINEIVVSFYDGGYEVFEYDTFRGNLSTKGGTSRWWISS